MQVRVWIGSLCLLLMMGCGFHLRGVFSIPSALRTLHILPYQPFDPFQRALRQTLKRNEVLVINAEMAAAKSAATLTILNQALSERVVAYGSDGQANRAILELKLSYQLSDPQGKLLFSNGSVEVERELTINPNAVLGSQNERTRLQADLYVDAALQLVRQLSALCASTP